MENPELFNDVENQKIGVGVGAGVGEEVWEEARAEVVEESPPTAAPIKSWDDFPFKIDLLRGIYSYGFEAPSEIQKKAIMPMIECHDLIAQAQSGSGKTGTFTIGTLQLVDVQLSKTQAILMAPTHELARQIANVVMGIGSHMEGLKTKVLVGGTSVQEEGEDIKRNTPHIVIGCAGRIYDMMKRNLLDTSHVRLFVLDEADEMLSQGFKEQIQNIFKFFNENIQVALFSATMPDEIVDLTQKFMRSPVKIMMKKEELNLECIQQYFVAVEDDYMKYDTLKDLFSMISVNQCIIYCNSVKRVMELYKAMINEGFSVCAIHSSMDKVERDKMFVSFRSGGYRVMISSNVTARGIDIQQVSTVINFDVPNCVHTYLHRIGRSGRWGRKGLAINFITKRDIFQMKRIESYYKIDITELPANVRV
jgi:translation initiation factor 4A